MIRSARSLVSKVVVLAHIPSLFLYLFSIVAVVLLNGLPSLSFSVLVQMAACILP